MEIWKPIVKPVDLTGRYEISSTGRYRRSEKFIRCRNEFKPPLIYSLSKSGRYLKVSAKKDGILYSLSIHRLVCYAFIPNPENKPQINHKNANKHDNRVENLEWCTQSENIRHAQALGIMKYAKPKIEQAPKMRGRAPGFKGITKKIIDLNSNVIYQSVNEVSLISKICIKTLRRMLSGERINRTSYRYIVNGVIKNDVILPSLPKPKKEKILKVKPPKKEYIPHPLPLKKLIMFDTKGNVLQVFASVRDAAKFMASNYKTFRTQIRKSPNNYYKGFVFKYA